MRCAATDAMGGLTTSQADPQAHGHHVLVCLDWSPSSETALPYVLGVAKTFGSAVTLEHANGSASARALGASAERCARLEISRREASAYLERLQKQTTEALRQPTRARLEQGQPAERIVELAREIGANPDRALSHGEGAGTTSNLGSTAQQVLAMARSSVFIVHPSKVAPNVPPKRLLVPLDGSPRTESVLPTAARIARGYEAELLLVHVVQELLPTLVLHAREDLALAHELAMRLEFSANRYLR